MSRPRLLIFASGAKDSGGSGFENLARSLDLDADIVAVVSTHEHGGVRQRAECLDVPFVYFDPNNYSQILKNLGIKVHSLSDAYRAIIEKAGAEWAALSGWFRKVEGLDPARTFNIHPALLSFDHGRFGGKGMYGDHIHDAVQAVLEAGEITESGLSMHFVTDEMDRGPVFFEYRVPLQKGMTADEIAKAVNKAEHEWQPKITHMVVHGQIRWDGKDPRSLTVPDDYAFLPM